MEYAKAKDVTEKRLYLESMSEIIPNLGENVYYRFWAEKFTSALEYWREQCRKCLTPRGAQRQWGDKIMNYKTVVLGGSGGGVILPFYRRLCGG